MLSNAEEINIKGLPYLVWPEDDSKNPTFKIVAISDVPPDMYKEVSTKYYNELYKEKENGKA